MSWHICVPATSANLGPGFDCLALALDLWNEVDLSAKTDEDCLQIQIEGEGQSYLPQNESNAIYCGMRTYAHRHGKSLPGGIKLLCRNRIPISSGLGSSAAATVAGILCATALLNLPEDRQDQLACAAELEGHGDNSAACLLGGLTAFLRDGNQVYARQLPVVPLSLVVVTPDFHFSTCQARTVLPQQVAFKNAVENLSRSMLLIEALRTGDLELLRTASYDQLHQPYRLPLIPGAQAALKSALSAGAAAAFLSGAGPSLLAVVKTAVEREPVGAAMLTAFQRAGLTARIFTPLISMNGATVQPS